MYVCCICDVVNCTYRQRPRERLPEEQHDSPRALDDCAGIEQVCAAWRPQREALTACEDIWERAPFRLLSAFCDVCTHAQPKKMSKRKADEQNGRCAQLSGLEHVSSSRGQFAASGSASGSEHAHRILACCIRSASAAIENIVLCMPRDHARPFCADQTMAS